jgi:hypothetical protein
MPQLVSMRAPMTPTATPAQQARDGERRGGGPGEVVVLERVELPGQAARAHRQEPVVEQAARVDAEQRQELAAERRAQRGQQPLRQRLGGQPALGQPGHPLARRLLGAGQARHGPSSQGPGSVRPHGVDAIP